MVQDIYHGFCHRWLNHYGDSNENEDWEDTLRYDECGRVSKKRFTESFRKKKKLRNKKCSRDTIITMKILFLFYFFFLLRQYNARIAMNALLIIIALLEMVVAMYAMVICVQGCCGGKAPKQTALPVSSLDLHIFFLNQISRQILHVVESQNYLK